jgi:hypothetical protein
MSTYNMKYDDTQREKTYDDDYDQQSTASTTLCGVFPAFSIFSVFLDFCNLMLGRKRERKRKGKEKEERSR